MWTPIWRLGKTKQGAARLHQGLGYHPGRSEVGEVVGARHACRSRRGVWSDFVETIRRDATGRGQGPGSVRADLVRLLSRDKLGGLVDPSRHSADLDRVTGVLGGEANRPGERVAGLSYPHASSIAQLWPDRSTPRIGTRQMPRADSPERTGHQAAIEDTEPRGRTVGGRDQTLGKRTARCPRSKSTGTTAATLHANSPSATSKTPGVSLTYPPASSQLGCCAPP